MAYENGAFRAIARDFVLGKSSTGKEEISVLFEIVEDGTNKGKRITWYGYFTEGTIDRTLESCENAGWDGNSPDFQGIGSKECVIVIEDEEYQGKINAKVKWVNAGGRGLKKDAVLAGSDLIAFQSNLKAAILARKKREAEPDDMGF